MAIDSEALLELMRTRRSVRRFRPEPVPRARVDQLVEAARWAPTASNWQAFRLLILSSPVLLQKMREAVVEAAQATRATLREDGRALADRYFDYFVQFAQAPLVIAPIYRSAGLLRTLLPPASPSGPAAAERGDAESLCSVSAAMMNLLLCAHAQGLGACWMTGPLIAEPALLGLLAVPRGWRLAGLIAVGFPAEAPEPPPRRAPEVLARYLTPPDGSP